MNTIAHELSQALEILLESGVDSPQLDAEVLMAHVLQTDRLHVISHPEWELSEHEVRLFVDSVSRRSRREPLPHITGVKEFWGLEFEVTPDVLIPRPETETLVDAALMQLRGIENPVVADIGAGTGCVAVALAVELPDSVVYTTEVSPKAVEVAEHNAEKHQVGLRVVVLRGDMLGPLPLQVRGRLDAVVSNPPYIPSDEIASLQEEVASYEPRGALDGGPDGMDYLRRILTEARNVLMPGGWVHLEVGMGEAEAVAAFARSQGYRDTRITNDLAGIGRVVSAEA